MLTKLTKPVFVFLLLLLLFFFVFDPSKVCSMRPSEAKLSPDVSLLWFVWKPPLRECLTATIFCIDITFLFLEVWCPWMGQLSLTFSLKQNMWLQILKPNTFFYGYWTFFIDIDSVRPPWIWPNLPEPGMCAVRQDKKSLEFALVPG